MILLEGDITAQFHMYLVHIVPEICTILTFLNTEYLVMKSSHCIIMVILGVGYGAVTFIIYFFSDVKPYKFLDWDNPISTLLAISGITAFGVLLFLCLASITHKVKVKRLAAQQSKSN